MLVDKQLQLPDNNTVQDDTLHQCDNCRRRVFSTLMNITEADKDLGGLASANTILEVILKAFILISKKKISSDNIIDLAFKTLINIVESEPQYLEKFEGIRDLLSIIKFHYKDF